MPTAYYYFQVLVSFPYLPSGQNLGDSVENHRGLWLLVEGIHAEIRVVSEMRIYAEIQGKFLNLG